MFLKKKPYGRDYFEGKYGKYSHNSQRNRNRLYEILTLKREGTLLEIGCGKCEFLRMAEKYFQVEGIDISKYAIESSKHSVNGTIRLEDVENYHLRPDVYNVIAAFNVLEHLKQPDIAIQKIFTALRKGGLLIGSVPYNATLIGHVHTVLTNIFDPTHCSTYPPDRWDSIFVTSGFRKISHFGEVMWGKNHSAYIRHRFWRFMSLNLVFMCEK